MIHTTMHSTNVKASYYLTNIFALHVLLSLKTGNYHSISIIIHAVVALDQI